MNFGFFHLATHVFSVRMINMKVAVLGCGRWASFNAWYQSNILKNDTLMYGRADSEHYQGLSKTRKNAYLKLPKAVKFTDNLKKALDFADHIIIAISAQGMKELSEEISTFDPTGKFFILCMKGIIDDTGERLSEVLAKHIDTKSNKIVAWVGPGHAQELSAGKPNVMLIASEDQIAAAHIRNAFKSKLIRFYESDDLIGAEIGAAAKNVLGIIAGLLDGAELSSLKGALMARGVYEVAKLIVAMGGNHLTAYGISHLGDFEATLFSQNSHNRRFGEMLYRGEKSEYLAEGVSTSKAIHLLAQKHNVEMPISELCYQIVHENKDTNEGLKELFERDFAKEFRF